MAISLIGLVHPMIYFPLYETAKRQCKAFNPGEELSSVQIVCSAVGSKVLALLMTYPHIVVRNRLQFLTKNVCLDGNKTSSTLNITAKGNLAMIKQIVA